MSTACIIVFTVCPEQADQTQVSVQHMLAVHWGRFTSLWSRPLQLQSCYDRQTPPVHSGGAVAYMHGRGLCGKRVMVEMLGMA